MGAVTDAAAAGSSSANCVRAGTNVADTVGSSSSSARAKGAKMALKRAAARAVARTEKEDKATPNLSEVLATQTTSRSEVRMYRTAIEWRNRAILRALRRGYSAKLVGHMFR